MLRAEGIRKRYRTAPPVLAGVDLSVEPGAPVVLAGANGSGKSTLLRILAGCAAPTAGRVLGRPRVVGYLPDRFPAQLRMPAEVYLRHLARIRGVPTGTGPTGTAMLETLGFTGPRREPMARLSKGNAQKVGLAQALGCGAGLVLLDEPWAGLDVDAAEVLVGTLTALGAALVVTDHTGRAARIPGARHLTLEGGVVSEQSHRSASVEVPIPALRPVVLRCGDPAGLAAALGVAGRVTGDRLFLQVGATQVDEVLRGALQRGASVESVG